MHNLKEDNSLESKRTWVKFGSRRLAKLNLGIKKPLARWVLKMVRREGFEPPTY